MPTFAEFIAPFDPAEFRTHYYGRKPLHIAANGPSRGNPMPWQSFNDILNLTSFWNEDTLKVFYQNRLALRENYCDATDPSPGAKAPANPRKVKALLGFGASLVANQIQRASAPVAALVHMLQREFGAGAGANAYCSFQKIQAFNTHYDLHDVFALQTEGEKLWRIYEARADNPTTPTPPGDEAEKWLVASRGRLMTEVLMRPGDILYLPRGQYHDAITGAEASLHVTFWVKPATGLSLFKLLESAAAAESAFRADLPDPRDTEAMAAHLAGLARHLDRLMTSPSFQIEVRNHQRSLASQAPGFELPSRQRAQYFSTAKRGDIIRRTDGFGVEIDGKHVEVGATYPAVAWLLQQRLFSMEDLLARFPFVDEAEMHAVLQQLLAVDAIVVADMR
ncbi:cupin domain-containing protein [Ideonella sp. DXS29W]|uniref:Cupin domain-containing protein n=1 Tax=Ideonella lacteola TaxID=2984193 RepID=A0ABU9BS67_9BURK